MTPFLITLHSISLSLIILWIISYCEEWDDSKTFSAIAFGFVAVIGYGAIAPLATNSSKYEEAHVLEILKGRKVTLICTDIKNVEFSGYPAEKINDSTQFYWEIGCNHYGYEIDRELVFFNKN